MPSLSEKIQELFLAACDLPPESVGPFLESACGGDRKLQREVESLLAFDRTGIPESGLSTADPLQNVGGYRLLRRLGEGGMGEVYEAEQQEPVRRRVALKVIKWGLSSKEVLARFESERQALAMMSHPNIASILDFGTTPDGRPFFAMERVDGLPITRYCDAERLSTRERLELFDQVCQGVRHAHQKGVIHRDLKPSNVLVAVDDERAIPKIIDFGIAKAIAGPLTERTLSTRLGQWIGTPEYMSPEQAGLTGADVDTRTDVYSLGVILYELLVGAPPLATAELAGASIDEIRRCIREVDPPRPSTRASGLGEGSAAVARQRRTDPLGLVRQLRGDLDWIVVKALEKDRERRYGSPSELAADIRRHLRHEPVLAGPPSGAYRLRKFVRRNRLAVVAGALAALALLAGSALAGLGLVRARQAERQARQEAAAARQVSDFLVGVFDVLNPWDAREPGGSVRQLLRRGASGLEEELAGQPLVQARLLESIGAASLHFGYYEDSARQLERALAIRRELGDLDPEIARSHHRIGAHYQTTGDFQRAAEHYQRALEIFEQLGGLETAAVAGVLTDLAGVRLQTSRFDAAERLLERALEIQLQVEGSPPPALVWTLVRRAVLEATRAEWSEALATLAEALRIQEEVGGLDHPAAAVLDLNRGFIYLELGRVSDARPLIEGAQPLTERFLGPDHPLVAQVLIQRANLEGRAGDHEAARRWCESALAILEIAYPDQHVQRASSRRDYALVLMEMDDLGRAHDLLERAVEVHEKALGAETFEVALDLSALGDVAYRSGELDRARQLYRRSLGIRQSVFGEGHARVAEALFALARLTAAEGRTGEAMRLLRRSVASDLRTAVDFDDPGFSRVHQDREFQALAGEVRRRLEAVGSEAHAG